MSETSPHSWRTVERGHVGRLSGRLVLFSLCALALCACAPINTLRGLLAPMAQDESQRDEEGQALPTLVHVVVSGALEGYARELAATLMAGEPGVHVDVAVVTPSLALDMLASDEADLAIITRKPDADILSALPPTRTWQVAALAEVGLAVIVPTASGLHSIGQEELVDLFGGYILDWGALGLGEGAIEVVVQDASSPSRVVFDEKLLGGRQSTSAAVLVPDDQAAVDYVSSHPQAVGYATALALTPGVRVVAITSDSDVQGAPEETEFPATVQVVMVCPAAMSREVYGLRKLGLSKDGQALLRRYCPAP